MAPSVPHYFENTKSPFDQRGSIALCAERVEGLPQGGIATLGLSHGSGDSIPEFWRAAPAIEHIASLPIAGEASRRSPSQSSQTATILQTCIYTTVPPRD